MLASQIAAIVLHEHENARDTRLATHGQPDVSSEIHPSKLLS